MVTRRRIVLLLTAAAIASFAACGGVSTYNVQNPPPPPPSNLSIAWPTAPPTTIPINASATQLSATVSNDSSNAGVDWSLTCPNTGNCGSFSATQTVVSAHTESGQPVSYTPPSSFAGNSEAVNIVAFATADHTKNIVAPLTVTAFGGKLQGNYILQTQGVDSNFNLYQLAAVVSLDGNGGVISGQQTVNFSDPNRGGALVSRSSNILVEGSNYFLGPDGRGTITFNTSDLDIDPDQQTPETFGFVFLSSSQALISQFSLTSAPLQITARGTMDLQTSTAATAPGYAFAVSGTDLNSGFPTAIGGILNFDSPNSFSGKGSTTDQFVQFSPPVNAKPSGSISIPDGLPPGIVTLALNVPNFANTQAFTFTGYVVDANHIKLIESDNTTGAGLGSTAGIALGQASPGSYPSFSGSYVFGIVGEDLSIGYPSTATSVGVFTAVDGGAGTGLLQDGYMDTFLQSYSNPVTGSAGDQISVTFAGNYADAPDATGRVRSFPGKFFPHPGGGFHAEYIYYQTGDGNPAPVIVTANDDQSTQLLIGAGMAYPQSPAAAFGGNYGFSFTQQNGSEFDGTGWITALSPPPNSGLGSFSGSADSLSAPLTDPLPADHTFSGTFNTSGCSTLAGVAGCLPGDFSAVGNEFNSTPFAANFYLIDSNRGFFVETDLLTQSSPQVTFGYFACQTSVLDGTGCAASPSQSQPKLRNP